MNPVPWKYRNVINPWQTPREIRSAVKFIDRMLAKLRLAEDAALELVNALRPDRNWNRAR